MLRRFQFSKGWPLALALLMGMTARPAWTVHPCASCHPKEVAGYLATPMAHSISHTAWEPSATFIHPLSGTRFSVEFRGLRMIQRMERHGIQAEYEPIYALGSGSHAISYLITIDHHLFQSPLCDYPGRGRWDMAPGYENAADPDFYRPILPHCLYCHAGRALPVPGTVNEYWDPPFLEAGIHCERCHGPVEAHLRNPAGSSIINPVKLPPRERDSVCEQCHLSGEAFILNPGKRFSDFRVGESLEDVFTVYLDASWRNPGRPNPLTVISQSQQLALSRCAWMSGGKLWCGTCHNPHVQPANPVAYFRSRCLACHGAALLKTHPKPNQDCIRCHMPRLPVENGGHTIFTDHRIAIYTPLEIAGKAPPAASSAEKTETLIPWRDPPPSLQERNLGLADVRVGESVKSLALVSEGYRLLTVNLSKFPKDPTVLTAIGQVLLGIGNPAAAEARFERVIHLEPDNASNYLHAALAFKAAHHDKLAVQYLEKALQLDPFLRRPYRELAAIYAEEGNPEMVRQTYERYLQAFPQDLDVRAALSAKSK
jgi:hypothetical protein